MIVGALFLLLLIFQIPAGAVRLLLPAQAGVSGLSGTLWSGQAIRCWWGTTDKNIMLGRVAWRIEPWKLFWSTPLALTFWSHADMPTESLLCGWVSGACGCML